MKQGRWLGLNAAETNKPPFALWCRTLLRVNQSTRGKEYPVAARRIKRRKSSFRGRPLLEAKASEWYRLLSDATSRLSCSTRLRECFGRINSVGLCKSRPSDLVHPKFFQELSRLSDGFKAKRRLNLLTHSMFLAFQTFQLFCYCWSSVYFQVWWALIPATCYIGFNYFHLAMLSNRKVMLSQNEKE